MAAKIRIRGARVRNLQDLDLDLPLGALTVLTGVSGSGKSSLAIGVLHAESQRRYLRALGAAGAEAPPDVDQVAGLPPTLAIPARASPPAGEWVMETAGCVRPLAALFARWGQVRSPETGALLPVATAGTIADALLAEEDGARLTLLAPLRRGAATPLQPLLDELLRQGFSRVRVDGVITRIEDVAAATDPGCTLDLVVDRIRVGPGKADRVLEGVRTTLSAGGGRLLAHLGGRTGDARLRSWADHPWDPETDTHWPRLQAERFDRRRAAGACDRCHGAGRIEESTAPCPSCGGSGLGALAGVVVLAGKTYAQLRATSVCDARRWLADLPHAPGRRALVEQLDSILEPLEALGLGHLPLGREASELAQGERGRLVLAARTAGDLEGVAIIADEPSGFLGEAGVAAVGAHLQRLRARGLTVIVIDHHPDLIRLADHVIEFGPGAGHRGGTVQFSGALAALGAAGTPASQLLAGTLPRPEPARRGEPRAALVLRGARGRSLRGVDLVAGVGRLTVVSGPSGAGKRTLVQDTLGRALAARLGLVGEAPLPFDALDLPAGPPLRLVRLERARRSGSRRSCVATACGAWTRIRALLAQTREARLRGHGPEHFSFNTPEGRCETCLGVGVLEEQGHAGVHLERACPDCGGTRLRRESRAITWQGHTAAELLRLDVDAALELFSHQRLVRRELAALAAVGLGHLPLRRSARSLSGGEHQRLQLARELARAGDPSRLAPDALAATVVVLDTPTAGLHHRDVLGVVATLQRLCDAGATVIAADVHPLLRGAADAEHRLGAPAGVG